MMQTVLDLTPHKALEYFMKSSNYSSLSLPGYFDFQEILDFVKTTIGRKEFSSCLKDNNVQPSAFDDVNYKLLINKEDRYSYRPLQLPNPYLYYFLVREITRKDNWDDLKNRFSEFQNPNCDVISLPLLENPKDKTLKATTINNWWKELEQRSIELSLQYKYIFITDISNCYPSIYTHSISWALHGKSEAKKNRKNKNFLGNMIDNYIMGMQYEQTNGIPQGGALFDFIAEMVLGYADLLLFEELTKQRITNYKILRYRDDFRIFSNNKEELEKIAMLLQQVLNSLNFQINSSKTKLSESIIENSIKADKLYYIANVPIYKDTYSVIGNLQQELLFIFQLAKDFPNSGSIVKLMNTFLRRLNGVKHMETGNVNYKVLCAIVADIAIKNPKTYNIAVSILGNLIGRLETEEERNEMINILYNKFLQLPYIGYLQIWMQRMTLGIDAFKGKFEEPLCQIVSKTLGVHIWNNDWLRDDLTTGFPLYSMCTNVAAYENKPIEVKEVSIFNYY